MNTHYDRAPIAELLEAIDVPEGAYERAEARYRDLGEWLKREQSRCAYHAPHIYPQGAFRLGTVIRPVSKTGDYDLDLGCRLREGIAKQTHSQEDLKLLVGRELEAYRVARNIESKLEPKHRCWRIKYADEMSFHMDIVPSIPEGERRRNMIREAMIKGGMEEALADSVARYAGAITDDSLANYRSITDEWRISNAEGYALWFEARSRQAQMLLEKGVTARVDDLPTRGAKGPLQQVVQLLKWHREVMFQKWPEAKPISVIITTLAAHAYAGERNVEAALAGVLERMADYVRSERPRVPNPINAVEDFADKWQEQKYEHLQLEANFWKWLKAAQEHFGTLATTRDAALFERTAISAFGCPLPGRLQELQVEERKRKALMEKVEQMKRGARTSSTGSIGSVGIANQAHKFYGDEKVDSDEKI